MGDISSWSHHTYCLIIQDNSWMPSESILPLSHMSMNLQLQVWSQSPSNLCRRHSASPHHFESQPLLMQHSAQFQCKNNTVWKIWKLKNTTHYSKRFLSWIESWKSKNSGGNRRTFTLWLVRCIKIAIRFTQESLYKLSILKQISTHFLHCW